MLKSFGGRYLGHRKNDVEHMWPVKCVELIKHFICLLCLPILYQAK